MSANSNNHSDKLPMRALEQIEVNKIDRNPNNPRLHFPDADMEKLADSIDQKGILVPVVVYPVDDGENYHLIDGERRWLCARKLGHDKIPAVISDPTNDVDNLLQMFSIHMVREPWEDMPTAWALEKLIDSTGTQGDQELSNITGLSVERVRRLKHALELPTDYQEYVDSGEIPLNFFWELKRNVIEPLIKRRPKLINEFGEGAILSAFVEKRLNGITTDTVSLRKVRPIINIASQEAEETEDDNSILDDTLRELITSGNKTIDEAYEDSVELIVEADRLERKADNFLSAFSRLAIKVEEPEETQLLIDVGNKLMTGLKEILDKIQE